MEKIRRVDQADIAEVVRLSSVAGWNQTSEDWKRLFDLAPEWCYGMDVDGSIAASTTAIVYPGLAWIGMVLTAPEYRGHGFARRLLERALDDLPEQRSRLDATDMGRPLYLKLGYLDEYPVERWRRAASENWQRVNLPAFHEGLIELDRDAFGYDRGLLLRRLAAEGRTYALPNAFAMTRCGRNARFFGPCVSASHDDARRLLEAYLGDYAGEPAFWDLCPDNVGAASVAREFGFAPVRQLMRMRRGPEDAATTASARVYAMAGFEFG